MRKLRRKLNSESGASIVIALIYFLLCLTVGAVVLTAATANAGRVTRIREEQQAYFTVRSAAELLRDEIVGTSYDASYEEHWGGNTGSGKIQKPTNEWNPGSDQLNELNGKNGQMNDDAKNLFERLTGQTKETRDRQKEFTVTADGLDAVKVTYQMDEAYNIAIFLDIADPDADYHSPMKMTIPATGTEAIYEERNEEWQKRESTGRKDEDGKTIYEWVTYVETIRRTSIHVKWGAGVITKGEVRHASS